MMSQACAAFLSALLGYFIHDMQIAPAQTQGLACQKLVFDLMSHNELSLNKFYSFGVGSFFTITIRISVFNFPC